jgi:hypothetical protein
MLEMNWNLKFDKKSFYGSNLAKAFIDQIFSMNWVGHCLNIKIKL